MLNYYSYIYLSHHPEFKKVLFCFNHIDTVHIVEQILTISNFEEVYIYCANPTFEVKFEKINSFIVKSISKSQLTELNLNEEDTVVCCIDSLNDTDLYQNLSQIKINLLLVDLHWVGVDSFSIWETMRIACNHMVIAKLKSEKDYTVLNWKFKGDTELSVIFPVYNVEKYVQQCIDTVTAWDAPYIEFLFVNDGSPDNSAKIIQDASKKDPRIKLFKKENGGCASARQFGLERAKGKYVGFIDPDDFVDESMLKKLFTAIIENSSDISYCGYNEFYNDTGIANAVPDLIYDPYSNGTEDKTNINLLIPFLRIGIWRCLFSKEMLDNNGIKFYTELRRFDDLPFKIITLLMAKHVVSVPEHLYYYRLDRAGQDVKADDEKLFIHFDIFHYLDEWFKKGCTNEQLDYYHLVKIDTHLWALGKLQHRLVNEYKRRAKKDLLSFYDYKRVIDCLKMYGDRKKIKKLKMILKAK